MSWKPLLAALLLALCPGFGSQVLAQRTPETVIVIQDCGLDSGTPPAVPIKLGQMVTVYQQMGGRLYVTINSPENPRGRNWGWIEATCALPLKKAVPHFDDLLKKDPKDATAYLGRAVAELALGQPDKVVTDCDQALKFDAKSVAAFHCRARAWIAKDQPEKAIADLGEVLRLEPERADAYRMRGDLWRKQKSFERAGADYSHVLRLSPSDCEVYVNRGDCRCQMKEYEKAIDDFNEALCRQPDAIHAYQGRGRARFCLSAFDKAEDDFTESIALQDRQASNWCRAGWTAVFQGDLSRVISSYAEFQTAFLRRADDYLDRARCRNALGNRDKALDDYNQALWIQPDSARGHHFRGAYWSEQKRYDLAMADFDTALKLDAKFAGTYHVLRGNCRAATGQYDKALADFDEALRLDPEDHGACNAASWFRATCKEAKYRDGKQAVALADKVCRRTDWKNSGSIDTLAAAHAEAGNFDEAVRWEKRAIEFAPPASKKEMAERLALYESHKPYPRRWTRRQENEGLIDLDALDDAAAGSVRSVKAAVGAIEQIAGGKILRRQGDRGHTHIEFQPLLLSRRGRHRQGLDGANQVIAQVNRLLPFRPGQNERITKLRMRQTNCPRVIELRADLAQDPAHGFKFLGRAGSQQFLAGRKLDQQQAQRTAGRTANRDNAGQAVQ